MDPICLQVFAAGRQSRSVKGLRPSGQLHSLEHGRERGGGVTHLQIRYFARVDYRNTQKERVLLLFFTRKKLSWRSRKKTAIYFRWLEGSNFVFLRLYSINFEGSWWSVASGNNLSLYCLRDWQIFFSSQSEMAETLWWNCYDARH